MITSVEQNILPQRLLTKIAETVHVNHIQFENLSFPVKQTTGLDVAKVK
ncbi:MAG: hypothetical protein AAF921_19665 [Cyanobacteria bacterium P01_D01_bin.44]